MTGDDKLFLRRRDGAQGRDGRAVSFRTSRSLLSQRAGGCHFDKNSPASASA
jgi:hypothetical protein